MSGARGVTLGHWVLLSPCNLAWLFVPPQVWGYKPHLWRAQQDQRKEGTHVWGAHQEELWLLYLGEQHCCPA